MNIPILYINLDERNDRREYMEDILKNHKGTKLNYTRISAIKDENGWIGCAKSHIKCIDYAKKNNLKSVIILEDDFMFLDNQNFDTMKIPDFNYDILLLCNHIVQEDQFTYDSDIFNRVYYCHWTSGHLLNHTFYDILKNNLQNGIVELQKNNIMKNYLDHYWNSLWKNENILCICHKKLFATQREGFSNIQNEYLDRGNHCNHYDEKPNLLTAGKLKTLRKKRFKKKSFHNIK
jgi:GR25 family glycosyltransferase involved in LPS biosynthesis